MDTSKENIKMLEKAVEVQELWEPKQFDQVVINGEIKSNVMYLTRDNSYWDSDGIIEIKRDNIWIPTQDQLQGMVEDKYKLITSLLSDFCQFIRSNYGDVHLYFNSMEQLWLAFVMKEKFNKTWNGEDWT